MFPKARSLSKISEQFIQMIDSDLDCLRRLHDDRSLLVFTQKVIASWVRMMEADAREVH